MEQKHTQTWGWSGERWKPLSKLMNMPYDKAKYEANREKFLKRAKKWHKKNLKYFEKYYENHKEKMKAQAAEWYSTHKDAAYAKKRERIAHEREAYNEYMRGYRKSNPERFRGYWRNRKMLRMGWNWTALATNISYEYQN